MPVPPWFSELEIWEKSEYDGIKGWPPDEWLPEPHRKEFSLQRANLLILIEEKKATYTEIRSRFDYFLEVKHAAIVLALSKDTKPYDDAVKYLAMLYRLSISRDREESLRQLSGELAVVGFRVRSAPQKRKAALYKPEIQEIGKAYWAAHPTATMKDIMNSEAFRIFMKDKKPFADRTITNWLHEVDLPSRVSKRGPKNLKR